MTTAPLIAISKVPREMAEVFFAIRSIRFRLIFDPIQKRLTTQRHDCI